VKVRTMRSDLDAMAKSGGGLPRFQNVKITGLSQGDVSGIEVERTKSSKGAVTALIVIVIVAAVVVGGYFAYKAFFAGAPASTPVTQSPNAATPTQTVPPTIALTTPISGSAPAPAALPTSTAATTTTPFVHASVFIKKPADQVLTLTLSSGGAASNASDLQTFSQKLTALLATANKSANLIEIDVKGADGHDLSVSDILTQANAAILDPQFLDANFNPDATFFVYRDANGFWPGFVLQLKAGENWLFLKDDVQKLESSPNIANLFLENVGNPSADGFTDSAINGTAVRVLPFPDASAPAYFIYGWYESDLIFGTSESGLAQAMGRF
jgi:hypothetical protein